MAKQSKNQLPTPAELSRRLLKLLLDDLQDEQFWRDMQESISRLCHHRDRLADMETQLAGENKDSDSAEFYWATFREVESEKIFVSEFTEKVYRADKILQTIHANVRDRYPRLLGMLPTADLQTIATSDAAELARQSRALMGAVLAEVHANGKAKPDTKTDTAKKTGMPEGDGLKFCRFLKRQLHGRNLVRGEQATLAEQFLRENPDCISEADSLWRKARDYQHLWKTGS